MDELDKNNKLIFLIPVDGISNNNISKNTIEVSEDKSEKDNSMEEDFNKDFFENNLKENDSNLGKNIDNSKIYSYSFLSKYKIISIADSSKLYMSEYLKKNWKKKIKRLIIKLKKRYTKQSEKISSDNNINNLPDIQNIENKSLDFYFSNNPNNFGHHHQNYQSSNCNMEKINRNIIYNISNLNIPNIQKNSYSYYIFNHHNNNSINK